jgi:ribosome maturation factor RimP
MNLIEQIEALITPSANAQGYDIIQVRFNEAAKRRTLQIMAERSSDKLMTLEDCETLSRTISAVLDVEDMIEGRYALEVGSPGIDRPLTRPQDYDAYIGFDARIELVLPYEGRKRFSGVLLAHDAAANTVSIRVDNRDYTLPMASIQSAKLILTEALIKASSKQVALNEAARTSDDVQEKA